MKQILCLLILLPLCTLGQQNLVPNGNFEDYIVCPDGSGQWYNVQNWSNVNGSSPDYYNVCGNSGAGVPENHRGFQYPHSGAGYMGLYGVQFGNQQWREYIQTELMDSISPGLRYEVRFHLCLAEKSSYAITTMGGYFSKEAISSSDLSVVNVEPQILNGAGLLNDTMNWMLVTDTFISRFGGERYLTIGNFFIDTESDTTLVNISLPQSNGKASYYIDDVSVIAIDTVSSITEMGNLQFSVYPNPAKHVVQVKGKELAKARLLDMSGREVLRSSLPKIGGINISQLPLGLYLLEVTNREGRKAVQKLVLE